VRAVHAAAGIRAVGIDSFATSTEDARPSRREPGEVGADQLIAIGWVDELNPLTREI